MGMEWCGTLPSPMPGSFTFESSLTPKLDVSVGAKSHFFLPPSSATSSLHSSRTTLSTLSTQFERSNPKRKRSQADERAPDARTNLAYGSPVASMLSLPDSMESPAPLANERYRLAGGLDTPTSTISLGHDYFDAVSSVNRYRAAGDPQISQPAGALGQERYFDYSTETSALSRERNGQARIATSPNIRDGLGRTLYHVAGVAGKVLEFCRNTAFRGFFAGGGAGYKLQGGTAQGSGTGELNRWHPVEEKDLGFWRDKDGACTPVPGRFPEEDFIPDYMSQDFNKDHTSPVSTRAAKRVQREKGAPLEISENWMMVGEKGSFSASREVSPSRLSNRKLPVSASAASTGRRTAPRPGRRPILPASRTSLTSYAGSPSLRSDRPASFASPRSPSSAQRSSKREPSSPASVEVQRHAARMRKRELEEDKNLSRFNQQLKAMIREGKEALGSKVEVEDEVG